MEHKNNDQWNPSFYNQFLGYESILPWWKKIEASFQNDYPNVEDFNLLAEGLPFRFMLQQKDTRYELEAYINKRIPMRARSWHDFFNNLTWLIWPRLKTALNQRIGQEIATNQTRMRTPLHNLLTHFDECGIVISTYRPEVFRYIEQFQWKTLFLETKDLAKICEITIIGHGLLETALAPYIGMTGKALFLHVEPEFFSQSHEEKMAQIDQEMANHILAQDLPRSPQVLHPFPLLGWPGWWPGNGSDAFFDNQEYFRKSRKKNHPATSRNTESCSTS